MPRPLPIALCMALLSCAFAQENHDHGVPERLGTVWFPVSCAPAIQQQFNRGVALLHSFAYSAALGAFQQVAAADPTCAMAHWGAAMTYFHQQWDPPLSPETIPLAQHEIQLAQNCPACSPRERQFISALGLIFEDARTIPYITRAQNYEGAMRRLAAGNPDDPESQVFYALALLANVDPADKTHARQKEALARLAPLQRHYRQHPGIAHYTIHACDNEELASRGLAAARAYAHIAPSAPHALHMPSHIFTRLGLWDDSIASNLAARRAAHQQGDIGEELHAMDYLVYAYLQTGRHHEARQIIEQLDQMRDLDRSNFKVAYAATAMPIRFAVERGQWAEAANISPPEGAPLHVVALAVWARGLGLARNGNPARDNRLVQAQTETDKLQYLQNQLHDEGLDYWAIQTGILKREVLGWIAQSKGDSHLATTWLSACADDEDAMEKLPVTPGPILPAREQLGSLLLEQDQPALALKEFRTALANAPGRRGAIEGFRKTGADLSRNRHAKVDATNLGPQSLSAELGQSHAESATRPEMLRRAFNGVTAKPLQSGWR